MSADPTYDPALIQADPAWDVAFVLSEIQNDNAPLGWSKYIWVAQCLLDAFEVTRKPAEDRAARSGTPE